MLALRPQPPTEPLHVGEQRRGTVTAPVRAASRPRFPGAAAPRVADTPALREGAEPQRWRAAFIQSPAQRPFLVAAPTPLLLGTETEIKAK